VRSRALLLVAACSLLVVACNNPTYNRGTVERELHRDAGLTASQAKCLASRLEQTITKERLGARDLPTSFERDKTHAALVFSIIACSDAPYDRARIERDLERKAQLTPAQARCLVEGVERRIPPRQLASGDNLKPAALTNISAAIFDATVDCGGNALQLRRNTGLTRQQIACISRYNPPTPPGAPVNRRTAFVQCTATTTSTTTTTTTISSTSTS
jgi:hypothetical protein